MTVYRFSTVLAAGLIAMSVSGEAFAQELIAWPAGSPGLARVIAPGMPIRPLPRPIPPRPVPIPVPVPKPPTTKPDGTTPLALSGYKVEGRVTDNAAELTYTVAFHNPSSRRMEGVLVMPVPADTVMSGFRMTMGGKMVKGELLDAKQASTIYQNIVRRMADPGLLELVGERMIRARVFPIEPRSDIVVKMSVSQILRKSGGLHGLVIPMRSATMTGAVTEGVSVRLELETSSPIRTLYSPLEGVRVTRKGDRKAVIEYRAARKAPGNLDLFYSVERDPLAAGLLTFKEDGEDGFFMLSLSPKREPAAGDVVPKDIVFIVDRSGSMEDGAKMEQARRALSYCVRKLGPGDRFGIVDFATDANLFERRLVPATKDNKARAVRYVRGLEAAGGTNIEAALGEGIALVDGRSGRMSMVFFLTDGLPTVGRTDVEGLLRMASEKNKALRTRLFSFGVGDDVNTLFLDKLAEMNRGARDYVRPGETIENKVSALYQKVAKPALTDVRIAWEGVEARQVYPKKVSDIFYGGELVLLGRYSGEGKGRLVVTGKAAGRPARFVYPVDLPANARRNAFIPKLWANLKVAHELDAVRLAGTPDPEVVRSIVRLAKRYGIVTPYTSYLITEDGDDSRRERREAGRSIRAMRADAAISGFGGGKGTARRAQKASGFFSKVLEGMSFSRSSSAGAPAPASRFSAMDEADKEARNELKKRGIRAVETRSIGGKTFYLRRGVWTDGSFDADKDSKKTRKARYLSEEYFKLLKVPGLAKFLSLGPSVTVKHRGIVYQVAD